MHVTTYTGVLCTLAAPAMGMVWESLSGGTPNSWSLASKPAANSTMALSIALSRQNLDQLESKLIKLSTPGQEEYGQWLEKDEIDSQFPIVDDASVVSWLHKAGISNIARDGALLNFTGSVDNINQLLDASFAYYQNGETVKLRTTQYSIPDELAEYIDIISPTVYFGKTRSAVPVISQPHQLQARKSSPTEVAPACQTSITPSCLKEMYNVGDYVPKPAAGSRIGFGSFLNESAQQSDLEAYQTLFDIPTQRFTVELINGGVDDQNAPSSDIGEANLDVQLISAVSHPLPIHEFITGGVAYANLHATFFLLTCTDLLQSIHSRCR
jgi:tripeptidyl-peptidase-1